MSAKNETFTVQEILFWPPARIQPWLDTVNVGGEMGGRTFNWEVLASTAASRALNPSPSLIWARISSRIYDALIERQPPLVFKYTLTLMNLRANMIRSFGADSQDDLLNPDRIAQWCSSLRVIPIDEASRISPEQWETMPGGRDACAAAHEGSAQCSRTHCRRRATRQIF